MPKPKELLAFGEQWRPYRTIASWYMWRAFERAGYAVTNKIRPPKIRRKRAKSKDNKSATAKSHKRKSRLGKKEPKMPCSQPTKSLQSLHHFCANNLRRINTCRSVSL